MLLSRPAAAVADCVDQAAYPVAAFSFLCVSCKMQGTQASLLWQSVGSKSHCLRLLLLDVSMAVAGFSSYHDVAPSSDATGIRRASWQTLSNCSRSFEPVKPLATAVGFVAQVKSKHPNVFDMFCSRAGKPPVKLSQTPPGVKSRQSKSPCIKCNCKWHLKVVVEAVSIENAQHANSGPQWRVALPANRPPPSFSEGHNHDLAACAE